MTDFRSKIRKSTDAINIKNIIVLIFGDPGMGKTSLSFTADSPLHLDYDRGYQRSVGRKDSMEITSWQDGIDLLESNYIEENKIKTLVVDTIGTMLDDFCSVFLINESSKNGKPGGGLALQGYGAMKEKFKVFKSLAQNKNVDLVFLCHSGEEKDNDILKKIPKITGGSYDIIKAAADLIGFMESVNGKRTLDFNSTDRHDGKNCPEFPKMELPHYTDPKWQNYLSEIIASAKERMNRMSEEQQKALEQIQEFQNKLKEAETSDILSVMLEHLELLPQAHKIQLRKIFDEKFVRLWSNEFILTVKAKDDLSALIKTINDLQDERYKKPLKVILLAHADKCGFTIEKGETVFKEKAAPKAEEQQKALEQTGEVKSETKTEAVQ